MNNVDDPKFWDNIYLNDNPGWDLNGVTPIFKSLTKKLKKGKVCFVGCGRGYDAVYFAKKGFDVTAVDFSSLAIKDLKSLSKKESVSINCIQEDIFTFFERFSNYFDYIIEQTCFCAIHPSRRNEYEMMARTILKPKGSLIGLWFPLDKKIDDGGPPWGVTVDEVKNIFSVDWAIVKEKFHKLSIDSRKGREKFIIFSRL